VASERPRLVLAGGSGFLGRCLREEFRDDHEIVVLTRDPGEVDDHRQVAWNARDGGDWEREIDGAKAVINLAGRSVDCRYNEANRRAILESRVHSTRAVGAAIAKASTPPPLWINASSATIYPAAYELPRDEESPLDPSGFSEEVCRAWEREVDEAQVEGVRKVKLRISLVLADIKGSAFAVMRRMTRLYLGGTMGPGDQFVSWIHHRDFRAAVRRILEDGIEGPVNLTAPDPVPNREFMATLREACGVCCGIPAPTPLMAVGAFFLRTEPELMLKSRRVVPARLLESGFEFAFPTWSEAAADLAGREVPAVEDRPES